MHMRKCVWVHIHMQQQCTACLLQPVYDNAFSLNLGGAVRKLVKITHTHTQTHMHLLHTYLRLCVCNKNACLISPAVHARLLRRVSVWLQNAFVSSATSWFECVRAWHALIAHQLAIRPLHC